MTAVTDSIDRLSVTNRPARYACGYHHWSNLLFVHWRVPADVLQPLVPRGLTIDTWDGSAWLGLVAFELSGVRPWWAPAMPWVSSFPETNIRTYVLHEGQGPGVWFFSLDAPRWLVVQAARWGWSLNYQWAQMELNRTETQRHYLSQRLQGPGGTDLIASIGPALYHPELARQQRPVDSAIPGTLEFFLIERYLLYTANARGDLWRGQVYHRPYPLCAAEAEIRHESLIAANGIPFDTPAPEHVLFSPGVDVDVFSLERL